MSKKEEKLQHQEETMQHVEEALTQSEAFIEKNQKPLALGVLALVVVFGLIMLYNHFVAVPKEREAQEQMFVGQTYFERDSFNLAINGDGSFLGFKWIVDEYGSTKAGNLSQYYLGVSYMHMGEFQKAIDHLEQFGGDDVLVSRVATGAIGDCYMELGNVKKAVSLYLDAADAENNFSAPFYLLKAGRAYEKEGENTKAAEIYQVIKNDYPASPEARDIDKYIQRASVKK